MIQERHVGLSLVQGSFQQGPSVVKPSATLEARPFPAVLTLHLNLRGYVASLPQSVPMPTLSVRFFSARLHLLRHSPSTALPWARTSRVCSGKGLLEMSGPGSETHRMLQHTGAISSRSFTVIGRRDWEKIGLLETGESQSNRGGTAPVVASC